jgi:porphobilinogen deaminase
MKVATRKSKLAMMQSEIFARRCEEACEIVGISTSGDIDKASPLAHTKGQGVFVDTLNTMVKNKDVDAAAHSAKDLPNNLDSDLEVVAAFDWKWYHDIIITREDEEFYGKGIVGTSSPRRTAQIRKLYPKAEVRNLRGNVDTRLKKLWNREYDAILMSEAAARRMFPDMAYKVLPLDIFVPAPNQGIIAVVARKDSPYMKTIIDTGDRLAERRMKMERAVSRAMEVGCSDATGIFFDPTSDILHIDVATDRKRKTVVRTVRTESEAVNAGLEVRRYMEI